MVRVVKEYDERFQEFLDAAQALFYEQGYEGVSVRQIIDAVGVAKGTFYHYFESKGDLLDAVVERMLAQSLQSMEATVADDSLPALAKFNQLFRGVGNWKLAHKELVLSVMRTLYREENVLLRTRLKTASVQMIIPLLAEVIRQGLDEGCFAVEHPEEAAEVVLELGYALSDSMSQILLHVDEHEDPLGAMQRRISVYNHGIERVLGAAPDSLHLMSANGIEQWLS